MQYLLFEPIHISETLRVIIEVGIIFLTLYGLFLFLKKTGGASILKGMIILLTLYIFGMLILAQIFELYRIVYILQSIVGYLVISILIIFQYEVRRGLIRISQTRFLGTFFGTDIAQTTKLIVNAVSKMAQTKTGAIIVLEKGVNLAPYTDRATKMDCTVSAEILLTIFYKGTPLHDGAVVIRNDRIVAASCFLPLSDNPNLSRRIGTRHRAAIGISEQSDALAVVVSEETGLISTTHNGEITRGVDRENLENLLLKFYQEKEQITADTKLTE